MSVTRNAERESAAKKAAETIQQKLNVAVGESPIGLVLGTGWGDVLDIKDSAEIPFGDIPGFERLGTLRGHNRRVVYGRLNGGPVLALRGRVHLNEAPHDPAIPTMVRLQIEMLLQLGVKTLLLTSAVGSLRREVQVGDIIFADGFITLFAPQMPLWAGEFCSPEDALDEKLGNIAFEERGDLHVRTGGHAMVLGPFFEGRKYDKAILQNTGASVVGMSILPEACIAALYDEVRVLALCFVTNTAHEAHSHEENLARAKKSQQLLGAYLARIVSRL
ncbi:MAG: purine-nucleoside phosphorylase [Patescibacteria group bacterium]